MKYIDQSAPAAAAQRGDDAPRVPRQTDITPARRAIVVAAMMLGTFAIGTTEFVSMGLLPLIADDFGITEDKASWIISIYALGVVVGAPLITAFTGHIPRRRLLILLMGVLVAGHLLSLAAPNYPTLMAARFIAGLPHGAYFSVAGLSAASLAPPGKRGQAVALIGIGLSIATIIGVPVAQVLGQQLGWNAAYALVAVLGVLAGGILVLLMPHMTKMKPTSVRTELGALTLVQVWATVIMATIGFAGMFCVYTFITWTMTEQAGLDVSWMWLVLMAYGIGNTTGAYIGGILSDRGVDATILFSLVMIVVVLISFYLLSSFAVPATIAFGLVGCFGSMLTPALQVRLMDVAGDAQTLASSLNQSALNMANAAGAAIGGAVVAAGHSYSAPALAGAAMAGVSIVLWFPTVWHRRRQAR
ncbi:MFS transporter [Corynebacterium uterequi]|uniref:MFS transporter n=1 Tax=Corynebacterium uterequi TaxID=1072256 RepID=UPI0038B3B78C